jgi:transcription initiation factor TFIID subunit 6
MYTHLTQLHQLTPSILTCILSKTLSLPDQDHYELRKYSCKLLGHICRTYGKVYQTLLPRATKTLLRCLLDPHKPISSIYGALAGLNELAGPEGIKLLVLPNVVPLQVVIQSRTGEGEDKLKALLVEVLVEHLKTLIEGCAGTGKTRKQVINALKTEYAAVYGSYAAEIFAAVQ